MAAPLPAALILDVDGTLACTEEAHRAAFNAAFAAAGLPWHWDVPLYARLLRVTGGRERILHYAEAFDPPAAAEARAGAAALHAAKNARYAAAVRAGAVRLRPGVARLLGEAGAAGVPLALATTTGRANAAALLEATLGPTGMARFAAVCAGEDVAAKKPDPEAYVRVLARLGADPARCVAFEDSGNGLRAARAAGLPCLVTPDPYTEGQDFAGALAVLSDLGEPGAPARVRAGAAPPGWAGHVTPEALGAWLAAVRP